MAGGDNHVREGEEKMKKTIQVTQQELSGIRTGRASTGLVDNLKVDYYGALTPLKQIAAVSTPDSKTLEIRPWDKNAFQPIEKAISQSELKLAPQRQGDTIRLIIPPLTQERRQELIKVARKVGEEGKVAIRNVRQETNARLKAAKEAKSLSEDDMRRLNAQVQKLTDQYVARIDELLASKEKEITSI